MNHVDLDPAAADLKELTVVVTAPPQRAPRCYAIIAAALSLSRRKTIEGTEFRAWKGYSSRPSPYSSVLSNRALFPSEHEPHSWHTVNGPSSAHFPRETYPGSTSTKVEINRDNPHTCVPFGCGLHACRGYDSPLSSRDVAMPPWKAPRNYSCGKVAGRPNRA